MLSSSQPLLSAQDLAKLRRLRASVLAFQTKIAPLPAQEFNDADNEQFNQFRRETKIILKSAGFDREVPRAITQETRTERVQKVLVPRLFGIMTIGVFLVLVGLGVNSIILDQLIINVMSCLVSSTGMLLVIGTFVVYQINQSSSRLSNYADLYQRCEALLGQIDAALAAAGVGDLNTVPTVAELALDSLRNLAADWESKLAGLEAQAAVTPSPEMMTSLDYVRRELGRVRAEQAKLEAPAVAQPAMLPAGRPEPAPPAAPVAPPAVAEPSPEIIEQASAHTMGMPLSKMKAPPPPKKSGDGPPPAAEERAGAYTLDMPPVSRDEAPLSAAPEVEPAEELASAHTMGMPPISAAEVEDPEAAKAEADTDKP